MSKKKSLKEQQKELLKGRIMTILSDHIGKPRAIGMGELYTRVYGNPWRHRINDTRKLRELITELRLEGRRICSSSSNSGGGYYLAATGGELETALDGDYRRAVKILAMRGKMLHASGEEILNQLRLNLTEVTP